MSYQVYKLIHLSGIISVICGLAALISQYALNKGQKSPLHKQIMLFHGIGLLLIFVSGFGLLAKLSLSPIPAWVWTKLGIWVFLGVFVVICRRAYLFASSLWAVSILVSAVAIYLAVYKPF